MALAYLSYTIGQTAAGGGQARFGPGFRSGLKNKSCW
ncbi:hypothetical protein IJ22_08520 [Paenibacillus naphthalenovorans]|uniref:Uncharacterized protein n=1 Tax=Paenibacillus naphthalenovorans TaxID=162209 RepID=A0A0U2KWW6_9BACL|nr:hypothetical protein IJ22_08520 [Paenibacillus naphthalenovorans]